MPPSGEDERRGEGADDVSTGFKNTFPATAQSSGAAPTRSGSAARVFAPPLDLTMPRALVVRRVHFNAAHRLHNPAQSDEWNRATFGPCNNPNYHGHNYEVELCIEGEISPETGYVVDVGIVKALFDEHVHAQLDHRNLNLDVPWFADRLASAENIAIFIWEQIAPRIPAGRLARVRLWESPRNYVEYEGH